MTEFGRYTVLEEIGHGAMGAVYKANDPVVERVVAIKTILAAALAGPQAEEYRERFKREARAAGRLSHPGVVTVYDVGVQDGTPYLVMEFVPSRTLETALLCGDHFTIERTYELGQQLGTALGYAHKNGVIHRDIKPANILLTLETPERAKITDFGVAKLSAAQATSTGGLLGTPAFMAPEQFTGMGVDGRSDLFSLGVVLYWMATGDKPFSGDTITAVSYKIVHTEPIPPRMLNRAISPAFEGVILKCLEKDPAQRYQSGELLAQDLGNLREGRIGAGRISAIPTGLTLSPEPDTTATVPLSAKIGGGRLADSQETQALGTGEQMERIAAPLASGAAATVPPGGPVRVGSNAASSEIRAEMKAASAKPKSGGGVAPSHLPTGRGETGSLVPGMGVPTGPRPQPRPRSGGSRRWMIAAAVLLSLGILWGASIAKKKQEEAAAAASLAAQQNAASKLKAALEAHAAEESKETKKQETAEQHTDKNRANQKSPPEVPGRPKIEKAREESREPPLPDISHYVLRLEIYAIAPATVEVQPDDRAGVSRLLKAGHKILVGADKVLLLRTDNAGALRLKMNDRDLAELGPLGAPRTVRLTARDLKSPNAGANTNAVAGWKKILGAGPAKTSSSATPAPESRGGPATIQIAVPNMPDFADIIVWVDDKPIFRQLGTSNGGFGGITEQRKVPPGAHIFRVYLGSLARKTGIQKTISGDFAANQAKTLRIDTRFRGLPHDVSQLGFSLTIE